MNARLTRLLASRRQFLQSTLMATSIGFDSLGNLSRADDARSPSFLGYFRTRGVVLRIHDDLSSLSKEWPRWARKSGLTTIGTHITPSSVTRFIESDMGQEFVKECLTNGLEIEHELHAINDLLPRALFSKDPSMFRMNDKGERVADFNCCVHSKRAIEIICTNAVKFSKTLKPTTGRYFYWLDDNRPVCACPECREYSASDQAVIVENAILKALKKVDSRATLAHLAYLETMSPPKKIKPDKGLFLEFAPIRRSFNRPLHERSAKGSIARLGILTHGEILDYLDANLDVFPKETAQVLEYWLDVSLFSEWKRPSVKLEWRRDIVEADLNTYAERGIRHITSFANFVDKDYTERFGHPYFVEEYGQCLENFQPRI